MRWFNRQKVRSQFLLIGLFILPFLAGLAGVGTWGVFQINGLLQEVQEQQLPSVYDLDQAVDLVNQVRVGYRDVLLQTDPAQITQLISANRQKFEKARQYWEQYLRLPAVEDEMVRWPQIEQNWQQWGGFVEQIYTLAQLNTPASHAQAVQLLATSQLGEVMANNLSSLATINYRNANQLADVADQTLSGVLVGIGVSGLGVILVVIVAGLVLARSIITLTTTQLRLNLEINQALSNIEGKRQFGEKVSQQLKSMTMELNATSNQQADGSQQQANALAEIVTSVSELSQTAQNIATSSKQIDVVAEKVLISTREVQAVTGSAVQTGEQGRQAIHKTIVTNQKVNQVYEELVQMLNDLFEQSSQIKEVINLMRQLSDETHLLSLNAAIEAAGAGEQGERFGVVAGAVKELANRSVISSREVNQILSRLQSQIQQAVASAESGKEGTAVAVTVAQETGAVIEELVGAIKQSAGEVTRIGEAMRSLNDLTQEITLATTQQSSASVQVVGNLQEIGVIAKQNAGGSLQVNSTVHELEELAHELNFALAA